jgi:hypothetical protein
MVPMKNNTLIHRMADWLDRKYFSQNTCSARAKSPWYEMMPISEPTVTTNISARNGRQNQPIAMAAGMTPSKIPFSYTSMCAW